MSGLPVSVVVLNRDRDRSFELTIAALAQQTHRGFELVVVTNRPQAVARHSLAGRMTIVPFGESNISAARNAGIAAAGGEIVAFCDDDAVPEPTWLDRLAAAFDDPRVGAAGGPVRGRNGISLQWGNALIDRAGIDRPQPMPEAITIAAAPIKTQGTNCAFRRAALMETGGFDTSYRYYLDETDMDLRIADAGWSIAFVPDAEVHHGYCENAIRDRRRAPRCLFEIGASKAHFLAVHGGSDPGFAAAQRRRLLGYFALGLIEGSAVDSLMRGLREGMAEGASRPVLRPTIAPARGGIRPFPPGRAAEALLVRCGLLGWPSARRRAEDIAQHARVTVLDARPSTRMATVSFRAPGYWLHRGGIFGRVCRAGPALVLRSREDWYAGEITRIAGVRALAQPAAS